MTLPVAAHLAMQNPPHIAAGSLVFEVIDGDLTV